MISSVKEGTGCGTHPLADSKDVDSLLLLARKNSNISAFKALVHNLHHSCGNSLEKPFFPVKCVLSPTFYSCWYCG